MGWKRDKVEIRAVTKLIKASDASTEPGSGARYDRQMRQRHAAIVSALGRGAKPAQLKRVIRGK